MPLFKRSSDPAAESPAAGTTGVAATPTSDAIPPEFCVTPAPPPSSPGRGARARRVLAALAVALLALGTGGAGFAAGLAAGDGGGRRMDPPMSGRPAPDRDGGREAVTRGRGDGPGRVPSAPQSPEQRQG